MRVLHFIYDHINNPWVGGGGAIRTHEIYRRLSNADYTITVISGKYSNSKIYKVNKNFKYIFIGKSNNYIFSTFTYAFSAYRFLKKNYKNYDIIIEDFAPWNPIFSFKYQENKVVILSIQNYLGKAILNKYKIFGTIFYLIEKFYPNKFRNVITINEELNKRFKINGIVIPQGVDYRNDINFIKQSQKKYVAFLGRIDIFQKGLDLLLFIIKELSFINFKIAGSGKEMNKFLFKIKNISNVEYVGQVKNIEKEIFIKNSKFLIMPSRFEGQGIVALEAAALGKPVIVSDIPELKYVVDNGFGISFKCGDAEDLKRKVEYLWNNQDLIEKLGKKGREYAKNFTWDKIANLYEEYLLKVYKDFYKK